MKKILAILLAMMVPMGAMACEMLPAETDGAYSGCAGWAVVSWCKEVAGIKSPAEAVEVLPVQSVEGDYIRGFAKGGLIRAKAMITVMVTPEVIGLHKVQTTIRIMPDKVGLVSEIVQRRTGTQVSAASVIASTLWRVGDTVSHIFLLEGIQVGTVAVHGESTPLWAGDFDGDGALELGFRFGILEKKPEPKPEPKPTPKPVSKPQQECKKVCTEIRLDLSVVVKTCVSFVKGCFKGAGAAR